MGGMDFVIFAGFVWLIDGRGYQRYVRPLVIMGMNAIAVYLASELLEEVLSLIHVGGPASPSVHEWIYQTSSRRWPPPGTHPSPTHLLCAADVRDCLRHVQKALVSESVDRARRLPVRCESLCRWTPRAVEVVGSVSAQVIACR